MKITAVKGSFVYQRSVIKVTVESLPKAWEGLLTSSSYLPVVVKTIERILDDGWSQGTSVHDFFEMVYIKKGAAAFEISGSLVQIGPNDIVIIKPGQPHKFTVKSRPHCELIVLNFLFRDNRSNEVSEASMDNFIRFVSRKEAGPFISLKVNQKNDIINIMNSILNERVNRDIGSDLLISLLTMELFVLISRALKMEWENSIKDKSLKLKELLGAAVRYIDNNFERDLPLGDIAKYVFFSESYFARAFREEYGISPINYLLKTRVERACEMLLNTGNKLSEIALSVGFSNQQRFNEIFKKFKGTTPLKFRNQGKIH